MKVLQFLKEHKKSIIGILCALLLSLVASFTLAFTLKPKTFDQPVSTVAEETEVEHLTPRNQGNWSDYAASSFAGGSGTQASPYLISNGAQLAKLAVDVNSQEEAPATATYYTLTNDIDLLDYYWTPIGTYTDTNKYFYGTFDGDGHVISGMIITGNIQYVGLFGYAKDGEIRNVEIEGEIGLNYEGTDLLYLGGIAGYVYTGEVVNCKNKVGIDFVNLSQYKCYVGGICGYINEVSKIENCLNFESISAYSEGYNIYVGGIAGFINNNSIITKSSNEGNISGDIGGSFVSGVFPYVSGIVGYSNSSADSASYSEITYCINEGEVNSTSSCSGRAGGISGVSKNTKIDQCYNTGNINLTVTSTAGGSACGGITGYFYCPDKPSSLSFCYNTGDIYNTSATPRIFAGGISGYLEGPIRSCFSVGAVTINNQGSGTANAGGISGGLGIYSISNCYFHASNNTVPVVGTGAGTVTNSGYVTTLSTLMKTASNYGASSFGTYYKDDGTTTSSAQWSTAWDFDDTWTIKSWYNDSFPTFKYLFWEDVDTSSVSFGGGDGSSDTNPYEISTAEQLVKLMQQVNAQTATPTGKSYKLTADINLSGKLWTPIGDYNTSNARFIGSFNGNGHKIIGMRIEGNLSHAGLFGYGSSGSIVGIGIEGGYISINRGSIGYAYVGSIVGYSQNAFAIGGCYNSGTVKVTATSFNIFVGGIVGYSYNFGSISGCYNVGDVSGSTTSSIAYVGGVVGYEYYYTSIIECYNTGSVEGKSTSSNAFVGGVTGFADSSVQIEACYNAGSVKGENSSGYVFVGGVAGNIYRSKITKSYNSGTINGISSSGNVVAGGLVGNANVSNDSRSIENCYNIANVSVSARRESYAGGILGRVYLSMVSTSASSISSQISISNCYNTGSIKNEVTSLYYSSYYTAYIGGICGCVYFYFSGNYSYSYPLGITDCFNLGSLSKGSSTQSSIGGIYGGDVVEIDSGFAGTKTIAVNISHSYFNSSTYSGNAVGSILSADTDITRTQDSVGKISSLANYMYYERNFTGTSIYTTATGTTAVKYTADGDSTQVAATWTSAWDFTNTWEMAFELNSYATFKWYVSKFELWRKTDVSSVPSNFSGGSGTSASPYLISSTSDFVALMQRINGSSYSSYYNKYYKLTADIDLSGKLWTPIGDCNMTNNYFRGTFDGDGYKITGMNLQGGFQYVGVFGYIYSSSTIKNIGVKNSKISINRISGNSCFIGGVVGYANQYSPITNCYNSGTIDVIMGSSSYFYIGGVVGHNFISSPITNCYNTGRINVTGAGTCYVGGILGSFQASSITDCYNIGTINVEGSNTLNVGGVVGRSLYSPITNCYNNGAINVTGAGTCYTGGVVGYVTSGSTPITITKSFVACNISTNTGYVGGILGYYSGSSYSINISECFFDGIITTQTKLNSSSHPAGGLIGYLNCKAVGSFIRDCYVKATINTPILTSPTYVKAWIGYLDSTYRPETISNYYYISTVNAKATSTDYRFYDENGTYAGDTWYYNINLNDGNPILKNLVWVASVAAEQPADDIKARFGLWHTITFDNQSATTPGTASLFVTKSRSMASITVPTRDGFDFGGYYASTGGSGTKYFNSDGTPTRVCDLNADTTLYAYWIANAYTITYNLNGGSLSVSNPSEYAADTPTFTLNNPTKTGYTFAGWTGTGLSSATQTVTITIGSTGNRSYTATYTPVVYTVTLDNQGAGTEGTATIYEKYNTGYYTNSGATTQMTTSANGITIPVKTGYTFGGYYTSTNGGGSQYINASGKLTSSASTTNFTTNDGKLYAKWTANVYTVSYASLTPATNATYTTASNNSTTIQGVTITQTMDSTTTTNNPYVVGSQYVTFNGTQAANITYADVPITVKTGEAYKVMIRKISGSFTVEGTGEPQFVADLKKGNVGDHVNPTDGRKFRYFTSSELSGLSNNGYILNSSQYYITANDANEITHAQFWIWYNNQSGTSNNGHFVFNNFKIQICLVKVQDGLINTSSLGRSVLSNDVGAKNEYIYSSDSGCGYAFKYTAGTITTETSNAGFSLDGHAFSYGGIEGLVDGKRYRLTGRVKTYGGTLSNLNIFYEAAPALVTGENRKIMSVGTSWTEFSLDFTYRSVGYAKTDSNTTYYNNLCFYYKKSENSGWAEGMNIYASNIKIMALETYNSEAHTINALTCDGYKFNGYWTAPTGGTQIVNTSGNIIANVSGYTDANGNWIKAANVTLYPHWIANKLYIQINNNGGTYVEGNDVGWTGSGSVIGKTDTMIYGVFYPYGITNPWMSTPGDRVARVGYAPTGTYHNTKSDATGNNVKVDGVHYAQDIATSAGTAEVRTISTGTFTSENVLNTLKANNNTYVQVYVKWTANTYTVTYAGNNATSGSTASSIHTYNTAKRLTANGFARAYTVTYNYNGKGGTNSSATATYNFAGWKSSVAAGTYGSSSDPTTSVTTSGVIGNQNYVKNLTSTDGASVTMTAQWSGGSVTLPTPSSVTGYTFNGWYGESSFTNKIGNAGASYTPTANKTLYAKWTGNQYTITYKDKNNATYSGTNSGSLKSYHTYGTATTLVNGYKKGYTFDGWFTNSACTGTKVTTLGATAYTSAIILYAKWTINEYHIYYNPCGGTISGYSAGENKEQAITYNTSTGALPTPTKTNYTFYSWIDDLTNPSIEIKTTDSVFSGFTYNLDYDLVLYARYTFSVTVQNKLYYNNNSSQYLSSSGSITCYSTAKTNINFEYGRESFINSCATTIGINNNALKLAVGDASLANNYSNRVSCDNSYITLKPNSGSSEYAKWDYIAGQTVIVNNEIETTVVIVGVTRKNYVSVDDVWRPSSITVGGNSCTYQTCYSSGDIVYSIWTYDNGRLNLSTQYTLNIPSYISSATFTTSSNYLPINFGTIG